VKATISLAALLRHGSVGRLNLLRGPMGRTHLVPEPLGPPKSRARRVRQLDSARACETDGSRLTAKESFPSTSVREVRNRCLRFQ